MNDSQSKDGLPEKIVGQPSEGESNAEQDKLNPDDFPMVRERAGPHPLVAFTVGGASAVALVILMYASSFAIYLMRLQTLVFILLGMTILAIVLHTKNNPWKLFPVGFICGLALVPLAIIGLCSL